MIAYHNDNGEPLDDELKDVEAEQQWEDPEPIPAMAEVMPFDYSLLPKPLQPWVSDIADRMQCPPDFPAVAIMCALSSLLGHKVAIRPKRQDDWTVIRNLWGFIVGRPGMMKTPAVQQTTLPLKKFEHEAAERFKDERAEHDAVEIVEAENEKLARQEIKKALKEGDRELAKQIGSGYVMFFLGLP